MFFSMNKLNKYDKTIGLLLIFHIESVMLCYAMSSVFPKPQLFIMVLEKNDTHCVTKSKMQNNVKVVLP